MSATFQLTGRPELDQTFTEFVPRVQRKVLRPIIREAAETVREAAWADTPIGKTGELRESLTVQPAKRTRANKGQVLFQVFTGAGFFQGHQFYGAFVEFGHKVGRRPARLRRALRGDTRRTVEGVHMIERGYQSVAAQAAETALARIAEGIEKEAALAAKRTARALANAGGGT